MPHRPETPSMVGLVRCNSAYCLRNACFQRKRENDKERAARSIEAYVRAAEAPLLVKASRNLRAPQWPALVRQAVPTQFLRGRAPLQGVHCPTRTFRG